MAERKSNLANVRTQYTYCQRPVCVFVCGCVCVCVGVRVSVCVC